MAATQLNRARTIKKVEKPRPLKLNQRHATVDGRITTGNYFIIIIIIIIIIFTLIYLYNFLFLHYF